MDNDLVALIGRAYHPRRDDIDSEILQGIHSRPALVFRLCTGHILPGNTPPDIGVGPDRGDPVLPEDEVVSLGNIPAGIDIGLGCSHTSIDDYAAVGLNLGSRHQLQSRRNADGDDDQVSGNRTSVVKNSAIDSAGRTLVYLSYGMAGYDIDSGINKSFRFQFGAFFVEDGVQYPVLHLDDANLNPPPHQRLSSAHPDKPAADNQGLRLPLMLIQELVDGFGIVEPGEGENLFEFPALNLGHYGHTARGQQQLLPFQLAAALQFEAVPAEVDFCHLLAEDGLDIILLVEIGRAVEHSLQRSPLEQMLRYKRARIGGIGLVGDDSHRPTLIQLADGFGGADAPRRVADYQVFYLICLRHYFTARLS
ncbi:hypothetical protein ES703_119882 [subsurface metagenome]